MTDPLAALEGQRFTPSTVHADTFAPALPSAEGAAQISAENVSLKAKVAQLEAEIETLKERLEAERSGGGLFGAKHKARADKLAENNAELRKRLAELEGRLEAEGAVNELFLPAVAEVETKLAVVQEENFQLGQALQTSQAQLGEMRETLEDLEAQRDERDDLLRKEEARRQTAEAKQARISQDLALARMKAIAAADPESFQKQKDNDTPVSIAKRRVLAALGDTAALVSLGLDYLDGVCPICEASPPCRKERLLQWPHGKLIRRDIQDHLQLIVDQAQAQELNPYHALRAWCSGVDMEDYFADPPEAARAPEPDEELPPGYSLPEEEDDQQVVEDSDVIDVEARA